MHRFIPAPALMLAFAVPLLAEPAVTTQCYSDWGAAAEIIKSKGLMSVQELVKSARDLPGQIVTTTLCKDGDDYIYRLVVRDSKGKLTTVVLDADKPLSGTAK